MIFEKVFVINLTLLNAQTISAHLEYHFRAAIFLRLVLDCAQTRDMIRIKPLYGLLNGKFGACDGRISFWKPFVK